MLDPNSGEFFCQRRFALGNGDSGIEIDAGIQGWLATPLFVGGIVDLGSFPKAVAGASNMASRSDEVGRLNFRRFRATGEDSVSWPVSMLGKIARSGPGKANGIALRAVDDRPCGRADDVGANDSALCESIWGLCRKTRHTEVAFCPDGVRSSKMSPMRSPRSSVLPQKSCNSFMQSSLRSVLDNCGESNRNQMPTTYRSSRAHVHLPRRWKLI